MRVGCDRCIFSYCRERRGNVFLPEAPVYVLPEDSACPVCVLLETVGIPALFLICCAAAREH